MDVHPKKIRYLTGNLIHPHISSFRISIDFIFLWPSWQLKFHGQIEIGKQTYKHPQHFYNSSTFHFCVYLHKQRHNYTRIALPCTIFLRKEESTRQCSDKWQHIGCTARFQGRIPKALVTSPEAVAYGLQKSGLGTILEPSKLGKTLIN